MKNEDLKDDISKAIADLSVMRDLIVENKTFQAGQLFDRGISKLWKIMDSIPVENK